jgi:hypothetical protein
MVIRTFNIDSEIDRWITDIANQRYHGNRSRVINECVRRQMEIETAREKGVDVTIPGYTPLHIDKKSYSLLEEIAEAVNIVDRSELLEYIIAGMHAMLKLGVWRFLKPLPELAETVMREEETKSV